MAFAATPLKDLKFLGARRDGGQGNELQGLCLRRVCGTVGLRIRASAAALLLPCCLRWACLLTRCQLGLAAPESLRAAERHGMAFHDTCRQRRRLHPQQSGCTRVPAGARPQVLHRASRIQVCALRIQRCVPCPMLHNGGPPAVCVCVCVCMCVCVCACVRGCCQVLHGHASKCVLSLPPLTPPGAWGAFVLSSVLMDCGCAASVTSH